MKEKTKKSCKTCKWLQQGGVEFPWCEWAYGREIPQWMNATHYIKDIYTHCPCWEEK